MCLLLDKTDYQIPGTLEFGNLLKTLQGDQRYYREQQKRKPGEYFE